MDTWQVVIALLAAVFLGALLPVMFQLRATLRAMEKTFGESGPKVQETLSEVNALAADLRRTLSESKVILNAGTELATSIQSLNQKIRMASALSAVVAPAVSAFVQTMRATTNGHDLSVMKEGEDK